MGIEIEHKFLVVNDDWRNKQNNTPFHYTQGYLSFGDEGSPEVRVRLIHPVGDNSAARVEAALTVKSKGDLVRKEVETAIDVDDAKDLLAACVGSLIEKVRHTVKEANGHTFEIDVYEGALAGLVVAEIEVPNVDSVFDDQASFLGANITSNKAYKNAALARDGMPSTAVRPKTPGR